MSKHKNIIFKKNENDDKAKNDLSEQELIVKYIQEIKNEKTRIKAIKSLSKICETNSNLAIYLWYSTGTVTAILQEIINIYQYLSPPKLTQEKANDACAAISLFQCIAGNPETNQKFIESQLPIFLYPFLSNTSKSNPYEYIKLTSLGVIGALVKVNNSKIVSYLTGSEIMPLCLRIIERGTELSRCVASFILLRICLNDCGFKYICENEERYYILTQVLGIALKNKITPKILKYIIRILVRLSENKETRNIIKDMFYEEIKNEFFGYLDENSIKWFMILKKNLEEKESKLDLNIEKLKYDLTNKNENIKKNDLMINTNKNFNNNNKYQSNNLNNGEILNFNNMNSNIMLINQMNQMMQQKFMIPQNYNQNSNNGYNLNFTSSYKNS